MPEATTRLDLPILLPERIFETRPDYVLILPWNILDEVVAINRGIAEWGGRFVVAGARSGRLRLLLDEDEGRILAAHPDLDVPIRELGRDLHGGLAERLQQAHPGRAADRLAQAGGRLGDRIVADGGDPVEVCLE